MVRICSRNIGFICPALPETFKHDIQTWLSYNLYIPKSLKNWYFCYDSAAWKNRDREIWNCISFQKWWFLLKLSPFHCFSPIYFGYDMAYMSLNNFLSFFQIKHKRIGSLNVYFFPSFKLNLYMQFKHASHFNDMYNLQYTVCMKRDNPSKFPCTQ